MPGFNIANTTSSIGSLVPTPRSVYYTYTWEIQNLFEEAGGVGAAVYAQQATLPTFTANTETVLGSSLNYKYAHDVTWEDVKITFYDIPIGSVTLLQFMKKWRQRVWSAATGIGSAASDSSVEGYKRHSKIRQFTNDNNPALVVTWSLFNSWPQSIRWGDLTYTTSDIKLVETTITYDWADEVEGSP